MDGVQDRIQVDLASALPGSRNQEMFSRPSAQEVALASRNRSLSSENSRLQGEVGQLRSENSGLKRDISSLEQEVRAKESSAPSVPGYAASAEKGRVIDAFI